MEQRTTLHPAAQWAQENHFTPTEVACTIAVVLKILDGKCKMEPGEKKAVLAIFEVIQTRPATLFDTAALHLIAAARSGDTSTEEQIHALRLHAEAQIPKPTMKAFKARLRDALFG